MEIKKIRNSIYIKILVSIAALGLAVWLGGTAVRSAIAFDIFVPGDIDLTVKPEYTQKQVIQNIYLFSITSFYTMTGFGAVLLSGLLIIIAYRKNLKRHGWLFMAFVLICLAVPVEVLLAYYDIQLIYLFNYNQSQDLNNIIIKDYFFDRIKNLSVPSGLSALAVLTAVLYLIWKPLVKKENLS